MYIRKVNANHTNNLLAKFHYKHTRVLRSKLLAYAVFNDNLPGTKAVAMLLWASPHFTKKRCLFGMPNTLDKWEVLILARFWCSPLCKYEPSAILAECVGRSKKRGKHGKKIKPRGWRIQEDWCATHPPRFPRNPFVPRLLLSWSDLTLPSIECCTVCGLAHHGNHRGTIYAAAGWTPFDISKNNRTRLTGYAEGDQTGEKQSWILRLSENNNAFSIGLRAYEERRTTTHSASQGQPNDQG